MPVFVSPASVISPSAYRRGLTGPVIRSMFASSETILLKWAAPRVIGTRSKKGEFAERCGQMATGPTCRPHASGERPSPMSPMRLMTSSCSTRISRCVAWMCPVSSTPWAAMSARNSARRADNP